MHLLESQVQAIPCLLSMQLGKDATCCLPSHLDSKTAQRVEEAQIQKHMQHEDSLQQASGPTHTQNSTGTAFISPIQESKSINTGIIMISAVLAMISAIQASIIQQQE